MVLKRLSLRFIILLGLLPYVEFLEAHATVTQIARITQICAACAAAASPLFQVTQILRQAQHKNGTDAGASEEPSQRLELFRATRRKTKSKHGKVIPLVLGFVAFGQSLHVIGGAYVVACLGGGDDTATQLFFN